MPLKVNRDDNPNLNLTPMIDIVFLLIIFFMVGTRFSELADAERDLRVEVPRVADVGTLTAAARKRVVNVLPDGQLMLDNQLVTLSELQRRLVELRRQNPGLGVVVRGDGAAPYQPIAEVLAVCRLAEVTDVNISVRVASREH